MFARLTAIVSGLSRQSVAIDDFYAEFGRAVAQRRNALDLTQSQLAMRLGMSRASLANIERGEQRVYLHQSAHLAEIFGEAIGGLTPSTLPKRVSAANVSHSGDKINRVEQRTINDLVTSITASTRKR
jgi:transcriptional regulator with XRE-family HTH domain